MLVNNIIGAHALAYLVWDFAMRKRGGRAGGEWREGAEWPMRVALKK